MRPGLEVVRGAQIVLPLENRLEALADLPKGLLPLVRPQFGVPEVPVETVPGVQERVQHELLRKDPLAVPQERLPSESPLLAAKVPLKLLRVKARRSFAQLRQ